MKSTMILKDSIMNFIYGPIRNRQNNNMHELAKKNAVLLQTPKYYFKYKGELYFDKNTKRFTPEIPYPRLHPSLREDADRFIGILKNIESEEIYVSSYITAAIRFSESVAELMFILPSVLHRIIHAHTYFSDAVLDTNEKLEKFLKDNARFTTMLDKRLVSHILETL